MLHGLSVCHSREPWKNGWTDWDVIWVLDSSGLKEPCIRWGFRPPVGIGNFLVSHVILYIWTPVYFCLYVQARETVSLCHSCLTSVRQAEVIGGGGTQMLYGCRQDGWLSVDQISYFAHYFYILHCENWFSQLDVRKDCSSNRWMQLRRWRLFFGSKLDFSQILEVLQGSFQRCSRVQL